MSRARWADAALAGALLAFGLVGTAGADHRSDLDRPIDLVGYLLVSVAALALASRRLAPLATSGLVIALTAVYLAVGYPYGPMLVTFLVAVYSLARYEPPRVAVPAAVVAFGLLMIHVFTNDAALAGWVGVVPGSAWVVVPFALGTTLRLNAEAQRRDREEQLRRGVAEERLRVAQEVHDVVGHGLAAITMQANFALHLVGKDPSAAETALQAISRTGSQALDELRATVEAVGGGAPEKASGPGLARLVELVRRLSAAGVVVDLTVAPGIALPGPTLSGPADLAAYRVVQEALTNVLRHSEARSASVTVSREGSGVEVLVVNPARAAQPGERTHGLGEEGVGLRGMRQRVERVGGRLDVGPRDGRFEVRAWLPLA